MIPNEYGEVPVGKLTYEGCATCGWFDRDERSCCTLPSLAWRVGVVICSTYEKREVRDDA